MYTIKQAAARSGVPVPLLRAWERRYGVVSPSRTPSGYRLYDEMGDLNAFALVRALGHGAPDDGARVYCHLGGITNLAIAVGQSCLFTRPLATRPGESSPRAETCRSCDALCATTRGPVRAMSREASCPRAAP